MAIKINCIKDQKSIQKLVQLYMEVWPNSIGIIDLLATDTVCYLAKDPLGNVVGYCFVEEDRQRGFYEIQDIAVAESWRRKGIGSKLILSIMDHYDYIKLIVNSNRENVIQFYKKIGFVSECVYENYYAIGHDGIRMSWQKKN
jgi:ribosomal protein S18 acetylase RimI-like enzyme